MKPSQSALFGSTPRRLHHVASEPAGSLATPQVSRKFVKIGCETLACEELACEELACEEPACEELACEELVCEVFFPCLSLLRSAMVTD